MLMIEWVIVGTTQVITIIIAYSIGRVMRRKEDHKGYTDEDFIHKYYNYMLEMDTHKKIHMDRIKAALLKIGTRRQVDQLEKYYYKEKKKRLKEEIKHHKDQALIKAYQEQIQGKPLK